MMLRYDRHALCHLRVKPRLETRPTLVQDLPCQQQGLMQEQDRSCLTLNADTDNPIYHHSCLTASGDVSFCVRLSQSTL